MAPRLVGQASSGASSAACSRRRSTQLDVGRRDAVGGAGEGEARDEAAVARRADRDGEAAEGGVELPALAGEAGARDLDERGLELVAVDHRARGQAGERAVGELVVLGEQQAPEPVGVRVAGELVGVGRRVVGVGVDEQEPVPVVGDEVGAPADALAQPAHHVARRGRCGQGRGREVRDAPPEREPTEVGQPHEVLLGDEQVEQPVGRGRRDPQRGGDLLRGDADPGRGHLLEDEQRAAHRLGLPPADRRRHRGPAARTSAVVVSSYTPIACSAGPSSPPQDHPARRRRRRGGPPG